MNPLLRSMFHNSIGLGIFAIVTAGVIGATQILTRDSIDEARHAAQSRALLEVFPEAYHDNQLLDDTILLQAPETLNRSPGEVAFTPRLQGKPSGIILPVTAPDGYSGRIDLIVGIHADGRVLGVRVITHRETPGLGDRIEIRKSDWITGFNGRILSADNEDEWRVIKDGGDFDQLVGATITPRAVVAAVKRSLVYFDQHRASLLTPETTQLPDNNLP